MRSAIAAVAMLAAAASAAEWYNWNRLQTCSPALYVQPSSESEVVDIINKARSKGQAIKVVGAGHSFSGITLTSGVMLQLDNMRDPISVRGGPGWVAGSPSRPASGSATAEVQAGMRVHELNSFLAGKGLALENTGAIAIQSIAGATSTSTHGTGRDIGSMATGIVGLRLVLANGTVMDASATSNAGVFRVARVGLGALGVLVRVSVRVVPLFKLRRTATPYSLSAMLPWVYPTAFRRWPRMQWYYTPRTDSATLLLREVVPFDTPTVDCWNASQLLWVDPSAQLAPGPVMESQDRGPGFRRRTVSTPEGRGPAETGVPLSEAPAHWAAADLSGRGADPVPSGPSVQCVDLSYRALAHETDDYDLYEEMEMFVDVNDSQALIERFVAEENRTAAPGRGGDAWAEYSLFTGMRYVAEDDIPLSMMHGRQTGVVSFIALGNHTVTAAPSVFAAYARQLEATAASQRGRWHWGKMNWATAADTRRQYPAEALAAFLEVRAALDPEGLFLDDYLRQRLPLG